jgi:hypothetical protein
MTKEFDQYLVQVEQYIDDEVRPGLAKCPTEQGRQYFALFWATQLAAGSEHLNLSVHVKMRLQHEIAERLSQLL